MKLRELIDLETQLLRDEAESAGDITARDRAIGIDIARALPLGSANLDAQLRTDHRLRQEVSRQWLERLPSQPQPLPGGRIERGYRLLSWALVLVAALAGTGTAHAALAYDGTKPVNILLFVLVFFVGQLFLLAVGPLLLLLRHTRGRSRTSPWLFNLFVRWSRARWVTRLLGSSIEQLPRELATLAGRRSLYSRVEQWTLFALLQRLGIAFNLAALLTCLYLIVFTDLAFGWSSTLDVEPAALHGALRWLATPWSWLIDNGVPSLEVVQASRWDRMQKGYLSGETLEASVALAGQWWGFLIAGLSTYGLLPRCLAWATGKAIAHRYSRAIALDHIAFEHLFDRLLPRATTWHGPNPDEVRGVDPSADAQPCKPRPPRSEDSPTDTCHVVCWGRLAKGTEPLRAYLGATGGPRPLGLLAAGQVDLSVDTNTVTTLAKASPRRVYLLLDAGQQPTRDVLSFLARLREACGPTCLILVSLLEQADTAFYPVSPDERGIWESRLAAETDPYLGYEVLGAVP